MSNLFYNKQKTNTKAGQIRVPRALQEEESIRDNIFVQKIFMIYTYIEKN